MMRVDNSFFHQSYKNIKVLVLAPHPDDEINVAGNMIYNLSHMGAEVFIAYSTNGDFEWSPEIRFAEVRKSAEVLGVNWEHIILLGYGDTYNGTGHPHVFHAKEPMTSPAGHEETYGIKGKDEFAFQLRGKHSPYTENAFLRDVKDLLLYIRADIIFCVDYDSHADHRALSLTFEQAMGEILRRPDNDYHPDVYKRFAYATGFTAKNDFGELNLQETKRPVVGENESYDYDMIDKSIYQWRDRVRFPVAEVMRNRDLKKNPLAQAVFQHHSQHNERNALRLINSDEVYWQRRTDGISYQANVKVSSGDGSKLNDFQLLSTNDINSKIPHWSNYLWQPDNDDKKKEAIFTWKEPQNIEKVCLYGAILDCNKPIKVEIIFNEQHKGIVCEIPSNGAPVYIRVNQNQVINCKFCILEDNVVDCGISECEFYPSKAHNVIKPFIKILYNNNFIYEYIDSQKNNRIELSFYQYGLDKHRKYRIFLEREGKELIKEQQNVIDVPSSVKVCFLGDCRGCDVAAIRHKKFINNIKLLWQNEKNMIYIHKLHHEK